MIPLAGVGQIEYALHTIVLTLLRGFSDPTAADPAVDARVRASIRRLKRAYAQVVEEHSLEDLGDELRTWAPTLEQTSEAVQIWTDVIDSLMQDAEREYGPNAAGDLKKRRVKGAMLRWLRRAKVHLPVVPNALEPLAFERIVDWTIELVYPLASGNDLWTSGRAPARAGFLRRARAFIERVFLRGHLLEAIATRWIWRGVLAGYPLPGTLEARVEAAVRRTASVDDIILAQLRQGAAWVGEHQRDVAALVNLVSVAAHEAEGFLEATGAEKKVYAREIVLAVLDDARLIPAGAGVARSLVVALVDVGLDVTVNLFNKHGHFEHRAWPAGAQRRPAAPTRPDSFVAPVALGFTPPGIGSAPTMVTDLLAPLVQSHYALSQLGWTLFKQHAITVSQGLMPPPGGPSVAAGRRYGREPGVRRLEREPSLQDPRLGAGHRQRGDVPGSDRQIGQRVVPW
ncbi:hypothetical protein OJ998_00840 [Solirubrobacter taibaiensis]|nr:hypothetical protein [Solirubrobacter taibaiensis]